MFRVYNITEYALNDMLERRYKYIIGNYIENIAW